MVVFIFLYKVGDFMANYFSSLSDINSSAYRSIIESILSVEGNAIVFDKLQTYYNFENQLIFGMNILSKYDNIFKSNLLDYKCPKKYFYRPEYVCFELYGTTDLWYLLLYVNGMSNEMEFTRENIKVFSEGMVETINNLLKKEKILQGSRSKPIYLDKHYLKNPSEKSIDLLADEPLLWVDNVENNILYDVFENATFVSKYIEFSKDTVLDKNDKIKKVFTLFSDIIDTKDIRALPSNRYDIIDEEGNNKFFIKGNETYENKFKAKIYLPKGDYYYLNLYNGESDLFIDGNLCNKNDLHGYSYETTKRNFHQSEYTVDLRESHINYFEPEIITDTENDYYNFSIKNECWLDTDYNDECKVIYDQKIGKYKMVFEKEFDKNILNRKTICAFRTPYISGTTELENINAESTRIGPDEINNTIYRPFYKDALIEGREDNTIAPNLCEFLEVTITYMSNYNPEVFNFTPINIDVFNSDNEHIKTFSYDISIKEHNTNGEICEIKTIIPIYKNGYHYYKFSFDVQKIKSTKVDNNFRFNFISCKLRGIDVKSITSLITISEESYRYYDIEYNYKFKQSDSGLYFDPVLVNKDTIDDIENIGEHFYNDTLNNHIRHTIAYDTSLTKEEPFEPIKNEDGSIRFKIDNDNHNRIGYVKTTNISLPKKFVLNFKFNKSSEIGTSIMNIDGIEKNNYNTGVFFTISGKQSSIFDNTEVITEDGIPQQIIESGIHTYDFTQPDVRILQGNDEFLYHANKLMKFDRDNTVDQLQEFLLKEMDRPEDWYYKIIKNGNYLAVYTKKNLNDDWIFDANYTFNNKYGYTGKGSKIFEARDTSFSNTLNGEFRLDYFFSNLDIIILKFLQI